MVRGAREHIWASAATGSLRSGALTDKQRKAMPTNDRAGQHQGLGSQTAVQQQAGQAGHPALQPGAVQGHGQPPCAALSPLQCVKILPCSLTAMQLTVQGLQHSDTSHLPAVLAGG